MKELSKGRRDTKSRVFEFPIGTKFNNYTTTSVGEPMKMKDGRNGHWYDVVCSCGKTYRKNTFDLKSVIYKHRLSCRSCAGRGHPVQRSVHMALERTNVPAPLVGGNMAHQFIAGRV